MSSHPIWKDHIYSWKWNFFRLLQACASWICNWKNHSLFAPRVVPPFHEVFYVIEHAKKDSVFLQNLFQKIYLCVILLFDDSKRFLTNFYYVHTRGKVWHLDFCGSFFQPTAWNKLSGKIEDIEQFILWILGLDSDFVSHRIREDWERNRGCGFNLGDSSIRIVNNNSRWICI